MTNKPTEFEGGLNNPEQTGLGPRPENPIVKPEEPENKPNPPDKPSLGGGIVEAIKNRPKATQLPTNQEQQVEISNKIGEIIAKYGGESNVPVNDGEYWGLKAELNALRNATPS